MPFDQNKMVGTVLLDLSKAFNSAPHDLLITKLDIYGFDKESLSFMYLYLKFRKQSVRINSKYSMFSRTSLRCAARFSFEHFTT